MSPQKTEGLSVRFSPAQLLRAAIRSGYGRVRT